MSTNVILGRESRLIENTSDDQLLEWIGATSVGPQTKARLLRNIRKGDTRLGAAKRAFGDGVSVKLLVVNFSGFHFLRVTSTASELGKQWTDSKVVAPGDVDPQHVSPIFHGKAELLPLGCRGGVAYDVQNAEGYVMGRVAIAWENPWKQTFGPNYLSVACRVSKDRFLLKEALRWCEDGANTGTNVLGSVDLQDEFGVRRFIDVKTIAESETTSYVVVVVRTDDIAREVPGAMEN